MRGLFNNVLLPRHVGDFSHGLLTDRASGFHWGFTCQSPNLAALLGSNSGWSSWSGGILQTFCNTERVQIDALQGHPAITPQANGIHIDC
jgi:hypothetical protein